MGGFKILIVLALAMCISSQMIFLGEDPPAPSPSPTPSPSPEGPSTIDNLIGAFSKLTNVWAKAVDAFKTTRSTEIKERILGKGFDYFSSTAQIQISKGIKASYYEEKFLASILLRIRVPEEREKDIEDILEGSKYMDSNTWSAYNTLFSVDTIGNVKFVTVLTCQRDGKYDFLMSDIKADFKLAPDVLVIRKKLSVLGGIWSDDQEEYKQVPRTLTQEDLNLVMSFFNVVAFQGFAKQLGITIDFPKI